MTNAIVVCICGKKNKLRNLRSKKCRCGVVLRIESEYNGDINVPIATYPENNLEERRRNGKRVVNDTPRGWWS